MLDYNQTIKLSFIIPARNEEKRICATLSSIWKSCPIGIMPDIWVIDNNSTDQTASVARGDGLNFVRSSNGKTIAEVRNDGVAYLNDCNLLTSDRYLVFVDADTLVTKQLIMEMLEYIPHTLAGGAELALHDGGAIARLLCGVWNSVCCWKQYYTGCFMFVRADVFKELGGFNANLYLLEDVDLSVRLNKFTSYTKLLSSPVYTSARKLALFSFREHLSFWWKLLTNFHATITSPAPIWFEIRR